MEILYTLFTIAGTFFIGMAAFGSAKSAVSDDGWRPTGFHSKYFYLSIVLSAIGSVFLLQVGVARMVWSWKFGPEWENPFVFVIPSSEKFWFTYVPELLNFSAEAAQYAPDATPMFTPIGLLFIAMAAIAFIVGMINSKKIRSSYASLYALKPGLFAKQYLISTALCVVLFNAIMFTIPFLVMSLYYFGTIALMIGFGLIVLSAFAGTKDVYYSEDGRTKVTIER